MILSTLINCALDRDPEKSESLAKYNGKVIALECLPVALNVYLIIDNTHLKIIRETELTPDATISIITHKEIDVTGDLVFLQDFKNIMAKIDPDWEESLSQIIGDPLAHAVGNFLRGANKTQQNMRKKLGQDLAEYLQEEINYLPTRSEVEDFYSAVDKLHHDTERLEARITLIGKTS